MDAVFSQEMCIRDRSGGEAVSEKVMKVVFAFSDMFSVAAVAVI